MYLNLDMCHKSTIPCNMPATCLPVCVNLIADLVRCVCSVGLCVCVCVCVCVWGGGGCFTSLQALCVYSPSAGGLTVAWHFRGSPGFLPPVPECQNFQYQRMDRPRWTSDCPRVRGLENRDYLNELCVTYICPDLVISRGECRKVA